MLITYIERKRGRITKQLDSMRFIFFCVFSSTKSLAKSNRIASRHFYIEVLAEACMPTHGNMAPFLPRKRFPNPQKTSRP